MYLAQGHNTVTPLRLEPAVPQFPAKQSTTEPKFSLSFRCNIAHYYMIHLVYQSDRSGSVGRALDLRSKGREFETHQRHCVMSLDKTLHPLLNN